MIDKKAREQIEELKKEIKILTSHISRLYDIFILKEEQEISQRVTKT